MTLMSESTPLSPSSSRGVIGDPVGVALAPPSFLSSR